MTGTPVIITGVVKTLTSVPWNFQHIKKVKNHSLSGHVFVLIGRICFHNTIKWISLGDLKFRVDYSLEVNHYVLAEIKIQQALLKQMTTTNFTTTKRKFTLICISVGNKIMVHILRSSWLHKYSKK